MKPYQHEQWFHDKVIERLTFINKRIKDTDIIAALNEAVKNQNYKLIIQILLEDYYDPRYSHKQLDYVGAFHHIEAENTEMAVKGILKLLETKSALLK